MSDAITYQAAMTELEAILDDLEREDVDVDALSAKVRRAFELITLCRDRISATEMEINQIVADMSAQDGAGTTSTD